MASLIDVIFLLLLFFMLSSTFSRFAEVELSAATGGASKANNEPPLFLRLEVERLTLNGQETTLAALPETLKALETEEQTLLISLRAGVNAQRLTDLLVVLRGIPGLNVTVLETT